MKTGKPTTTDGQIHTMTTQLGQKILTHLGVPAGQKDVPHPRLAETHLDPAAEALSTAARNHEGEMAPARVDADLIDHKRDNIRRARRVQATLQPLMTGLSRFICNEEQALDQLIRLGYRRITPFLEESTTLEVELDPVYQLISGSALRGAQTKRHNASAEPTPAAPPATDPTTPMPLPMLATLPAPAAARAAAAPRRARRTRR